MTNMPEILRRMQQYKIGVSICFIMLFSVSYSFAAPDADSFMLDENGNVIQLSTISLGKKLALNKGFPLEDSNRGLLLTNFATGETISKFKPKKDKTAGLLTGAYALDAERIVLGLGAHVGIWNRKTNDFVLYRSKGSGESGQGLQISGVHPEGRLIISCYPTYRPGIFLHDLQNGSTTNLFKDYEAMSPRFSPDGSRYAFYGRLNRDNKDEESFLIIQVLSSEERSVYKFDKGVHGVNLSWSPSGKYLAGICSSARGKRLLYVWNGAGDPITRIPLSFFARSDWAPLWLPDEKDISLFYRLHFNKKDEKILQHTIPLREHGF